MIKDIQVDMKSVPTNQGLVNDVCIIIDEGRQKAYSSVNSSMIETYWKIGKRIVEEEPPARRFRICMASRLCGKREYRPCRL